MTQADDDELAVPGDADDVESLLRRAADLITTARPMPLSSSVMINRDEVLELLEEVADLLPEELRQARWLLRERDAFLAKVQRQGDEILDQARLQAERMVQRADVVRAAEHAARRTIEEADAEARRLRHEAEDYCDQKLAEFEVILDRTQRTVQAGRARLRGTAELDAPHAGARRAARDDGDPDGEFFDQDS